MSVDSRDEGSKRMSGVDDVAGNGPSIYFSPHHRKGNICQVPTVETFAAPVNSSSGLMHARNASSSVIGATTRLRTFV